MQPSPSQPNIPQGDPTGGNVCFCGCHSQGLKQCKRCKVMHLSPLGVKTDPADQNNPDIANDETI